MLKGLKNENNLREYFFSKLKIFFCGDFFRNPIVFFLVVVILFLNVVSFVALSIFIEKTASPVILHYNVYFGVDLIGDWWQIYILPIMGIFFFLINFFLAGCFYRQGERIGAYCLMLASLFVEIGIIIAGASMILINY